MLLEIVVLAWLVALNRGMLHRLASLEGKSGQIKTVVLVFNGKALQDMQNTHLRQPKLSVSGAVSWCLLALVVMVVIDDVDAVVVLAPVGAIVWLGHEVADTHPSYLRGACNQCSTTLTMSNIQANKSRLQHPATPT
eukprot:5378705-Amphidinium_carterae.1